MLTPLRLLAGNWPEHAAHLSALSKQIEHAEHEIHELIEHKNRLQDPVAIQDALKSLMEKHKELEQLSKEYEEERLHVRFKHPDRNDTVERQYMRYKLKALNEMEKEAGLDGRLSRIKARVMATFPLPSTSGADDTVGEAHGRGPASDADDGPERPEHIRLVK